MSGRTLVIGKVSRSSTRSEPAPPPPFPGAPPQPPKIVEEKYYYAKLADNSLVFEIKGDKLSNVLFDTKPETPPKDPLAKLDFPQHPGRAVDQLRDPNPVRIETDLVVGVTIAKPGQTLELRKTKGEA